MDVTLDVISTQAGAEASSLVLGAHLHRSGERTKLGPPSFIVRIYNIRSTAIAVVMLWQRPTHGLF